jgi:hypothetical protein
MRTLTNCLFVAEIIAVVLSALYFYAGIGSTAVYFLAAAIYLRLAAQGANDETY